MKSFRDLPLQRKMLVMTLSICGAVLCIAIAAFFAFQVLNFRATFKRDAATLTAIIATNATGVLSFNDDKGANELVASLRAKPSIISASLFRLPENVVIAQYGKHENAATFAQFPSAGEEKFLGNDLLLTQAIMDKIQDKNKDQQLGTLYVRLDYGRTFYSLLRFYALVILGIVIASIGMAWFLSNRLGRTITGPVLQLAQTAQVVGATKDYSLRAVVNERSDELGGLASSFNEMLGRIQTQDAALSLSQQKMQALIHSIDGIVWERASDTFRFTFISRQSEDILGYAPERWMEKPDFWESKLHPQDADKAIKTNREMAAQGQHYAYEYRMLTASGGIVWIRESGTVLMENGRPIAMRGIFHNITQSKLDAEKLDRLNRQLIDTSRNAGMADVATGVLHNVGNVLNSVSVAATVVADKLRRSKVANLRRATGMLREQNGHLAEYLTSDPKGRLIPEYLDTVAEELAGEQSELIAKMTTVGEHIKHIKDIVAMQQSYAKVSGVFEYLKPVALAEDALRINATAFDRHHINLIREFEPDLPAVCVDRHKVLQILINLLRNAKHAMEERTSGERRLVIRIERLAPDKVLMTVADNGIGIPAENMNRIFNHGFTTKKDGHGFGLHSGANSAREMGGNLTARSEGPGKGAEFTLELPIAIPIATPKQPAEQVS